MKEISTTELKELINTRTIHLLDVREVAEYEEEHIEQAQLVPLSTFPEALSDLDSNEEYYVICRSGRRSQQASMIMEFNGFTYVTNVEGGMLAWLEN